MADPGQYTTNNNILGSPVMGSNTGGLLSSLGGIGSSIVAGQGYGGAQSAYDTAIQQMISQQGSVYNNVAGLYNPARTTGNAALGSLSGALGLGGQAPNYSQFTNSPGYQFQLQQGTNNINRQASANGSLYTPNTMASLGQFSQGLAGTTYQNYINNLLSTAGLGAQATAGTANASLQTGNNVAQGLIGQGAANASGVLGKSGATGNLLSGLLGSNGQSGLLQQGYNAYNSLFGGGAGASSLSALSASDIAGGAGGLSDAAIGADLNSYADSGLAALGDFSSAGGAAAGAGAEAGVGANALAGGAGAADVGFGGEMAGGLSDIPMGAGAVGSGASGAGAGAATGGAGLGTGLAMGGGAIAALVGMGLLQSKQSTMTPAEEMGNVQSGMQGLQQIMANPANAQYASQNAQAMQALQAMFNMYQNDPQSTLDSRGGLFSGAGANGQFKSGQQQHRYIAQS